MKTVLFFVPRSCRVQFTYFSHGEFCFLYVQDKLFDISLCFKITNYHLAYYCYKDSSVVKVSFFFQIPNSTVLKIRKLITKLASTQNLHYRDYYFQFSLCTVGEARHL